MPATVSHVLSATTPDDPAYEIKPSNWNSAHALTLNISATEISGLFSNANGVSFGMSNNSITASIAAGGAPGSVSAGTTNFGLGEVVFSNSNGISFGLDGATVTATVQTNYLTTAMLSNAATISNIRLSAGTTSNLASAFTFANGNGISFGLDAGTLTATVKTDYLTSQSNQAASASNGSFTFQTLGFSNANNVTFGTSAGSIVTASVAATVAQSAQTAGWYASSNTTLTSSGTADARSLTVRGIGGISVGFSNGELLLSGPTTAAQTNQTLSFVASSNTTMTSTGTFDARSFTMRGLGVASVGFSNGEVLISVPAGGGVATASLYALGNTTQNSSTALAVTVLSFNGLGAQTVGFSNGSIQLSAPASSSLVGFNGITVSTAGSTISVGEIQASFFRQAGQITAAATAQANSLVSIQPFQLARDVVFSNVLVAGSWNVGTAANNSSAYQDVSISAVIYSRNASTLSSVASFSNTLTRTWSSNASQTVTGVVGMTMTAAQTTLSEGEYWVAFHVSTNNTATGGAATTALANTLNMILAGSIGSAANLVKAWGGQTANSMGLIGGQGIISTGATRGTIAFSAFTQTGVSAHLAPIFFELRNGTFQL